MNQRYSNKVALVTGAASGIGRATAIAFAAEGASVAVSDVDADRGEKVVAEIRKAGGKAIFLRADVSKSDDVQGLVKGTVKAFGRLDACFNNAGIGGPLAPTAALAEADWHKVIETNLSSVFLCMKYELPELLKNGGAIVNNASILGAVSFPNASVYTASKHGILGLTKATAAEYATQNIRVNALCPGFIETPMLEQAGITTKPDFLNAVLAGVPMKRLGKPEEMAAAVLWLCSNEASFVTGHPLFADGGYIAL
jgi:NAD(P)-dependent dehydrogenase (short-subunit alcohol dehydrogenase family)